jgi:hypothetical protein
MAELRRAAIGSSAAVAAAGLGLVLAFGVLLEPGGQGAGSCLTGLYPSTYADLLLPLHLLAAAVVAGALLVLARRLDRVRSTAIALGLAGAGLAAALAFPPLFGYYGLAALVLSIPLSLALALGLTLGGRAGWQRFAHVSWAGQWVVLVVLLPGSYAYAWLNGAGAICF